MYLLIKKENDIILWYEMKNIIIATKLSSNDIENNLIIFNSLPKPIKEEQEMYQNIKNILEKNELYLKYFFQN